MTITITTKELNAGAQAIRDVVNKAGYGSFVSDDACRSLAASVIKAVFAAMPSTPIPPVHAPVANAVFVPPVPAASVDVSTSVIVGNTTQVHLLQLVEDWLSHKII
jgi:hypothetical protein